ncbi:MAG: DUF4139 domain-containing protein [Theionarchaea archaeon]|nr:DUF4139 domain-containing protein [Theionarchaea archaeon]
MTVCVAENSESTELTIYNQNFGVVKQVRSIDLDKGLNTVLIHDVAQYIDATSVCIKDLTALTSVLEQNYLYDLVSKEKIYQKYIGKEITLQDNDGNTMKGVLLSYSGDQLIIENDAGVHIVKTEQVSLPELPEGLITKPTLKWLLETEEEGTHEIQLSYMTSGLNWVADYVAVINEDDSKVDLTCWVTITNSSGASYKNARLKLIAGDVHRVTDVSREYEYLEEAKSAPSQFEEETFFEYHLYTLQRRTDIDNNQQKQVTLFEVSNVAVTKEYVFDSGSVYYYREREGYNKIKVMLALENTEKNNMGIPLPKGKIRVYKKDSEGQLQFIGEDLIEHTPKDEKIRIYMGDAFDIVGEKKQTEYDRISDRVVEITYQVSLRNHKNEEVTIAVIQRIWGDWKMLESSHEWRKEDAWTAVWYVEVQEDGEATITYKIRIEW